MAIKCQVNSHHIYHEPVVTAAKLTRQTETATATRESSDIHTNTL